MSTETNDNFEPVLIPSVSIGPVEVDINITYIGEFIENEDGSGEIPIDYDHTVVTEEPYELPSDFDTLVQQYINKTFIDGLKDSIQKVLGTDLDEE